MQLPGQIRVGKESGYRLVSRDYDEFSAIWGSVVPPVLPVWDHGLFSTHLRPTAMGRGTQGSVPIRPGMTFYWADFCLDQDFEHVVQHSFEGIGLRFLLEGSMPGELEGASGAVIDKTLEAGFWGLGNFRCASVTTRMPAFERCRFCGLALSPEFIEAWMDREGDLIPDRLREVLMPGSGPPRWFTGPVSGPLQRAVEGITGERTPGAGAMLYREAMMLEALALVTSLIGRMIDAPLVNASERQRIVQAARLLMGNLAQPPLFQELCDQTGLSEYKLKRGFREEYGTTVAGFLRRQRMNQAQQLLMCGDRTIADIAAEVGFQNPSRFAEAFREEFGVNPSDFRKSDEERNRR